jgi:hypothetical protein
MADQNSDVNEAAEAAAEITNGYAVNQNGGWRAVTSDMELFDDEVFYQDVPQWAYDKQEADRIKAEKTAAENSWRDLEIAAIANQLMAIEEAEAAEEAGEEPPADLLPGTRTQWLSYRTKVRAWKEGNVNFPDETKRPVRPE